MSSDTPTSLLAKIVADYGQRFASDEHISGADLVEYLAPWLHRARATLDALPQPDPSRPWRIPNTAPAPLPAPEQNQSMVEHQFRVAWEIDVYAEDAMDAARKALTIQRNPASIATVFNVRGGPDPFGQDIDLTPGEGGERPEPPVPGGPL